MGQPVVHFEIIGRAPTALRSYYGEPFGWEFQTGDGQFTDPEGNLIGVAGVE